MTGFKAKKGFTIIEVLLVLAISGAIFAMVLSGTSSSAARRRYNDSVNDLAENLRNAYSATINVENTREKDNESSTFCTLPSAIGSGFKDDSDTTKNTIDNYPGRTNCAVYGQLITFGENNSTKVHTYDIIGRAIVKNYEPNGDDDVLASLKEVSADVVTVKRTKINGNCEGALAGTSREYVPRWEASVEGGDAGRPLYKGAVMIVRSPLSGTVHTYFYSDTGDLKKNNSTTIEVGQFDTSAEDSCPNFSRKNNYLNAAINTGKMISTNDSDGIVICVGSEDLFAVANRRRGIKIHGDGSTESAVEILSSDSDETREACK